MTLVHHDVDQWRIFLLQGGELSTWPVPFSLIPFLPYLNAPIWQKRLQIKKLKMNLKILAVALSIGEQLVIIFYKSTIWELSWEIKYPEFLWKVDKATAASTSSDVPTIFEIWRPCHCLARTGPVLVLDVASKFLSSSRTSSSSHVLKERQGRLVLQSPQVDWGQRVKMGWPEKSTKFVHGGVGSTWTVRFETIMYERLPGKDSCPGTI